MNFESLRIRGLRCLDDVTLALSPGINVFTGANGAGKTSILEAAFLLSHARSFRAGPRESLIQRGASGVSVFAELRTADLRAHRLGLGRESGRWIARVNGETAATLGSLVQQCAVVCFEPGSHALIAGGSEERRRFLDWGVFHVEPDFLVAWRRYQRALKQRNALLRSGSQVPDELIAPWEQELSTTGQAIDDVRVSYLDRLRPLLTKYAFALLPELGAVELRYRRGWDESLDLASALADRRFRDIARGHTTLGAHRADWSIAFEGAPQREHLSRGQEKLCALACLFAQAALYAERRGEWPIVCLDDLASELDQAHQHWVVEQLRSAHIQVLLTGTELPSALSSESATLFHVEQGHVTGLL
jgi:DNA replication and repair protein RecF